MQVDIDETVCIAQVSVARATPLIDVILLCSLRNFHVSTMILWILKLLYSRLRHWLFLFNLGAGESLPGRFFPDFDSLVTSLACVSVRMVVISDCCVVEPASTAFGAFGLRHSNNATAGRICS